MRGKSRFSRKLLRDLKGFKFYSKPKLTKWIKKKATYDSEQKQYILKGSKTNYLGIDYEKLDCRNLNQNNREIVSLFLYCVCHLEIHPKDMTFDLLMNIAMRYLDLRNEKKTKEIVLVIKILSQDIRR